jgi:small subunit ribosomal protein S1
LVHLSDISWEEGEDAVHNYKKGQEIEAAVLAIDAERERISLGIKQLEKDPFSAWLAEHPKNSIVKGTVTEVDARGATVDLGDGIFGSLRASEMARGRVEDARLLIKVGDEVEAKFTNVDRKNRNIALSIKAKEAHEEAEAMSSYKSEEGAAPQGTTLGELLKEKMGGGSK